MLSDDELERSAADIRWLRSQMVTYVPDRYDALLAEVRSLRAQREAVLHTTNDRLTPKEGADLDMYEKGMRYGWEQAMKRVVRALGVTE